MAVATLANRFSLDSVGIPGTWPRREFPFLLFSQCQHIHVTRNHNAATSPISASSLVCKTQNCLLHWRNCRARSAYRTCTLGTSSPQVDGCCGARLKMTVRAENHFALVCAVLYRYSVPTANFRIISRLLRQHIAHGVDRMQYLDVSPSRLV